MYQTHSITILKENRAKAQVILDKHRFDYDEIYESEYRNNNGFVVITFWIRPYIYEDFVNIVSEFRRAGI